MVVVFLPYVVGTVIVDTTVCVSRSVTTSVDVSNTSVVCVAVIVLSTVKVWRNTQVSGGCVHKRGTTHVIDDLRGHPDLCFGGGNGDSVLLGLGDELHRTMSHLWRTHDFNMN